MKFSSCLLVVIASLWTLGAPGAVGAPDIAGEYRIVEAAQPGGAKYGGTINITAQGPAYRFQWALDTGDKYAGPAIMVSGVAGAGYGPGLTGLAVYEIKGKSLRARWLLPATPANIGEYELTGPPTLDGVYKIGRGGTGSVTIKPHGKVYDIAWQLPTGSFTGVGVRVGDTLVAASGDRESGFGVAAYRRGSDRIEGVWTVMGETNLGTENFVPASMAAASPETATTTKAPAGGPFSANGAEVRFAGETYRLQNSVSLPGQPTSEMREYLRPGETFEKYGKMVALRLQNPAGSDPLAFTQVVLARLKKEYPKALSHEIEHTADSATMEFLIASGGEFEYNFWHYFKAPGGLLASVQFVLRSQPPFDSEDKLKAEHDAHADAWLRDAKTLAPLVMDAITRSAKSAKSAPPPTATPAPAAADKAGGEDDELVKKIQADLQTAGGIAGNFLGQIKAGKLEDAAALVSDEGLTRMHTTRKDFLATLQQTQRKDGRLLSFTPDRSKPDFGAEEGGMYFVLEADSQYEKAAARETLRFFRFPDGKVKMVGYQRSPKPAASQ